MKLNYKIIKTGLSGIVAILVVFFASPVPVLFAASPVEVEIVALDHWPIRRALEPTLDMLKEFGDKISITQIDADSKEGKARLKSSGMKGHIPVVIFVNGEYTHTVNDHEVVFKNFPVDSDSPMKIDGKWSAGNVKAVIEAILGAN
ncbi:MAG: hypothetical protein H8E38_09960 [SAR324 cluster bacterium]|nr:hypothetical protein [SAR324 cluster bacterium]